MKRTEIIAGTRLLLALGILLVPAVSVQASVASSAATENRDASPTTGAASVSPSAIATHPEWPVAKPEDVSSPEAIIQALYDVISGPKGKLRDWNRMRSLFLPADGRLIAASHKSPKVDAVVMSVDGYIERASPHMAAEGFFERSVHNQMEQFGAIVHVWSTYESRHEPGDVSPFARGINSIQLLKSGDRYYIVEVLWDAETPGNPLPSEYLGNAK